MAVTPRSDHVAVLTGSTLYVWGGCQYADGEELALPSDEIWIYDMDSGLWAHRGMGGEVPPRLSRTCGSFLQGVLYIFGGCDGGGQVSNQMYRVDLQDGKFTWRQMRARVGNLPSPRDRHSCWVYKERLIYFGGYGCKTVSEVNNVKSFTVNETSWSTAGGMLFRFWGWNSEVHVFEPNTATWTEPHTQGWPPEPRSSHASACLDSRGYVCGGLERQTIDIHCLDLVTWTWTHIMQLTGDQPCTSYCTGRLRQLAKIPTVQNPNVCSAPCGPFSTHPHPHLIQHTLPLWRPQQLWPGPQRWLGLRHRYGGVEGEATPSYRQAQAVALGSTGQGQRGGGVWGKLRLRPHNGLGDGGETSISESP
ncbi:kelch domain-containing protein 1-like isoform X3 [Brachyhypopomus gauderio]|uniref:kelch domain-containing protein 1-like isoform X3 n=1 Tax=Brachyhypopomus gauderio TaxID=698409 RepID=UPI004040F63B